MNGGGAQNTVDARNIWMNKNAWEYGDKKKSWQHIRDTANYATQKEVRLVLVDWHQSFANVAQNRTRQYRLI